MVPLGCREFGTYSVLAEGHLYSKSTGHLRKCARTGQPNYNYCHLPLSARNSYGAIRLLLYYGHMPLSAGCSYGAVGLYQQPLAPVMQRGVRTAQLDYNYCCLLPFSGALVQCSWTITTATWARGRGARTVQLDYNYCYLPQ